MIQFRRLYRKTVDSQDINDMPDDFTRLIWVLLPLGLDCEGRGIDNPSWIKSRIMPLREDVTNEMVLGAMDWFARREMIVRYEIGGRKYFYIPTWHTYQKGTERESDSELPSPPVHVGQPECIGDGIQPTPIPIESGLTHDEVRTNSPTLTDALTNTYADTKAMADSKNVDPPKQKTQRQIDLGGLEQYFSELTELPMPARDGNNKQKRDAASSWWTPLGVIYDLTGKDAAASKILIQSSVQRLRQGDMTISAPRSIEKTARSEWAKTRRTFIKPVISSAVKEYA